MPIKAALPGRAATKEGKSLAQASQARDYFQENVVWHDSGDPEYPYVTKIAGETLVIRLNDFPEEALYTLIASKDEVADFDDWPERWVRP